MVLLTAWVAKVATLLLWGVNEKFFLWFVTLRVREYMSQMDISLVIDSFVNASKLNDLIEVVDGID